MRPLCHLLSLAVLLLLSACQTLTVVLQEGAEHGDANMQYRYAYRLLERGDKGSKQRSEALKWFMLSAEQDYSPAQVALGVIYQGGLVGDIDLQQAHQWYEKAAKQKDINAYRGLLSLAIAEDDIKAGIPWLAALAKAGDIDCCMLYASMLAEGQDIPQDEAKAVDYWRYAALDGHAPACLMVGTCYANGWGVPQVPQLAQYWWKEAAKNGSTLAKKLLKGTKR